jgi:DNA invertase Pin-like site-specific DNA recombinase
MTTKRCAIYTRVSTLDQNISNQLWETTSARFFNLQERTDGYDQNAGTASKQPRRRFEHRVELGN